MLTIGYTLLTTNNPWKCYIVLIHLSDSNSHAVEFKNAVQKVVCNGSGDEVCLGQHYDDNYCDKCDGTELVWCRTCDGQGVI